MRRRATAVRVSAIVGVSLAPLLRPRAPLIDVPLIFGVDVVFALSNPGSVPTRLLDEPAHLATAVTAVNALFLAYKGEGSWRRAVLAGALVGVVLPYLDYIPLFFRRDAHTPHALDAIRPYLHSFGAPALLLAPAWQVRPQLRVLVLGAAAGYATHLLRDTATGGVPLLWPLSTRNVELAYAAYAGALLLSVACSPRRAFRRRATGP